jgi:hypothetical protein
MTRVILLWSHDSIKSPATCLDLRDEMSAGHKNSIGRKDAVYPGELPSYTAALSRLSLPDVTNSGTRRANSQTVIRCLHRKGVA